MSHFLDGSHARNAPGERPFGPADGWGFGTAVLPCLQPPSVTIAGLEPRGFPAAVRLQRPQLHGRFLRAPGPLLLLSQTQVGGGELAAAPAKHTSRSAPAFGATTPFCHFQEEGRGPRVQAVEHVQVVCARVNPGGPSGCGWVAEGVLEHS